MISPVEAFLYDIDYLINDQGESVSHPGLYPTGEGAGYAGGIMSAALDGLRAADQIVQSML